MLKLNDTVLDRQYKDILSMLDDLESHQVDAVIVDIYSMTSYKEILKIKLLKVRELIETDSGYGFVLAGLIQVLEADIDSMIIGRANVISDFIASFQEKLPVCIQEQKYKEYKI